MEKRLAISGELLARNSFLNLIGQAAPLLIGIFAIPFIIKGLGVERFGILSLVLMFIGYLGFFDLGLGRATTKFVAEALGKEEVEKLPHLVWTSLVIHLLLGLIGGLLLLLFIPLLVERLFNIPPALIDEAKSTFIILAISLPIILASTALRGVLEATQRFDLVNLVNIPSNTLVFLLPPIGLFFGLGLPGIMLLLLLSRFGAAIAYLAVCMKVFSILKNIPCFDIKLVRPLIAYGGWITVSNIIAPVSAYFDRVIIASFLTMAAVAYYTAPYEVVIRLWVIPGSMVMTLFPAFSSIGMTKKKDLRIIYVRAIKYLLLSIGPIVLVLAIFAGDVLRFWLGGDFTEKSTVVFQILVISALVGCMAPVSGALIQGLGRPDIISKIYLLYLLPNAALVWVLVRNLGIAGAAWSFAIRLLVDTTVFFIISLKLIDLPIASFFERGFYRCFGFLVGLGGLLLVVSSLKIVFFAQVLFVLLSGAIFFIASWKWVLDEIDRNVIGSALHRLS